MLQRTSSKYMKNYKYIYKFDMGVWHCVHIKTISENHLLQGIPWLSHYAAATELNTQWQLVVITSVWSRYLRGLLHDFYVPPCMTSEKKNHFRLVRLYFRPSHFMGRSTTLRATPSKIYDFSTNDHACIAMSTWCRCAPPILFWPWPPFNLFPNFFQILSGLGDTPHDLHPLFNCMSAFSDPVNVLPPPPHTPKYLFLNRCKYQICIFGTLRPQKTFILNFTLGP